jgi:glutamyl-tRNA reductase
MTTLVDRRSSAATVSAATVSAATVSVPTRMEADGRLGSPVPTVVALVAHARQVPSLAREAFAAELAALPAHDGLIVVHTCHRVEAYVAPASYGRGPLPHLPAGGERLEDAAAARHLISVACGLDSAVLGEDQILHQLRETHAARHAERPLDPVLDRLFQASLHAGRAAHSWFDGPPRSLADVALDRIAREVGPLEGRSILVLGVGRMGRLAAFAAVRRGAHVVIANRTEERATALAREVDGEVVPFGADGVLRLVDGVITAIGAEWPVGPEDRARLAESGIAIVDLSSPPAVPADLRAVLGERFVSVDDLATSPEYEPQDRLRRKLEGLVSESGREYCQWLRTRDAVPAIHAMASAAEAHRREELEWLLRRLPELTAEERALVEQMSHRLVAGILHQPLAALNADESGKLESAARELFRL